MIKANLEYFYAVLFVVMYMYKMALTFKTVCQ